MLNKSKPTFLTISLIALSGVSLGHAQSLTVTNYNAQNFSTSAGYVRGVGIISTSQPTPLRWQGNDPYNSTNGTGETDLVARVPGYTIPSPIQNSSLIQGGSGVSSFPQILPGTTNVQIWKSFTPTSTNLIPAPTVTFFTEWSLIPSLDGPPYDLADTFAFDLRNAANSASLLTLQLTPGINIQPNSYTLQTIAGTNAPVSRVDLSYQALFQLQVDMTGSSYNMQLWQINSTNRAVITNISLVTNGSLAAGMTAADFATIGLDWELASGNSLEPGSNYLLANQFQVTTTGTPVPEPGTWVAAALLGALAASYTARRRRMALQSAPPAN